MAQKLGTAIIIVILVLIGWHFISNVKSDVQDIAKAERKTVTTAVAVNDTESSSNRDHLNAVGSSTVYPFFTIVSEEFGALTDYKTPVVEATGTGGGFKLFCSGIGSQYPDFANASRAIKSSERDLCAQNGVTDITEIKIGYDGIVLANTVKSDQLTLTKQHIFLALAKHIPQQGKLVTNPYQKWSDIDPSLPENAIEVYGPPSTSGTRDAFAELVLEKFCVDHDVFISAHPDKKDRKKICHQVREDGPFIESGENDNLIIQKLVHNETALGIFGFSFLEENRSKVQGSIIEGVSPSFEHIADGSYKISRPLYVYAKDAHKDIIPGMEAFIEELTSDNAIGQEGYLVFKGLIPIPK